MVACADDGCFHAGGVDCIEEEGEVVLGGDGVEDSDHFFAVFVFEEFGDGDAGFVGFVAGVVHDLVEGGAEAAVVGVSVDEVVLEEGSVHVEEDEFVGGGHWQASVVTKCDIITFVIFTVWVSYSYHM